jgi:hypothetical protein
MERVGGMALGLTDYRHQKGNTGERELCFETQLNTENLVGKIFCFRNSSTKLYFKTFEFLTRGFW